MERKQSIENSGFMPQKGNPTQETVTYKIGGSCGCVSKHMGNERITDKRLENALKSRAGIISRDNRYIWQYISPQTLCLWVFLCRNAEKKTYGKPRRTRREGIANGLKWRKMDANEFTDRVFH